MPFKDKATKQKWQATILVEGYRFLSWLLQSIGQAFTRTTFKLLSDDLWQFISVTAFIKVIQSLTAVINQ